MSFSFPVAYTRTVLSVLLILISWATAWGNPVQTTSNESFLPTEEAFSRVPVRTAPPPKEVEKIERRYGRLIGKVAAKVGVDPHVVRGIVYMESRGNPHALNSSTDAAGLMGVTPIAQKQVRCGRIDTPERNLHCGSTYFLYLCDELEICEPHKMLLAYLLGPNRMLRVVSQNPWAPYTHPYVLGALEIANLSRS